LLFQNGLTAAAGDGFIEDETSAARTAVVEKAEGDGGDGVESGEDFENFANESEGVGLLFKQDPCECYGGKRPEHETLAAVDF